ncbi:MAG: hypothetical protein AABM29_07500 [Actinomycetota bacterium]
MLTALAYLLGAAELAAAVAAAWLGAVTVRRRLLPGWSGPPAWTADAVLAAALLLWVGELLGAVGWFRPAAYFPVSIAAGSALWLFAGRQQEGEPDGSPPPAPSAGAVPMLLAAAVAGLLIAHWSVRMQLALDRGMSGYDTLWYHQPFAAHFMQTGSTWSLDFVDPRYLSWFYPANSELGHAIGMLAFHRDILSPLLNSVWLAGALLAAWSVGRPHGAGPLAVIAVALLLDSGVMSDQAGSGRNDVIGICFLLAMVAVVENARMAAPGRRLPHGALAVAGLAAGLAAGVKLTFALPVAVMAAGIPLIAPAGRRRGATFAFGLPLLAGCGYWYLRNLVHAGNPFPWVTDLGPVPLPGPDQPLGGRPQFSVLSYLDDWHVVTDWFFAGLHDSLGVAWPLVLAIPIASLVLALRPRFDPAVRLIAFAGVIAAAAWLVHGTSAEGPPGAPGGFGSGLRHLAPALALGSVLLPVVLADSGGRQARLALLTAMLGLLSLVDASGGPWISEYLPAALAIGLVAFAGVLALSRREVRTLSRPAVAAAVAALAIVAVAAARPATQSYLEQRYERHGFSPPGLGKASAWAQPLHEARIATVASRLYPLYGADLSNRVAYVGVHLPQAGFVDVRSCRRWRRELREGGFEYVVIGDDRVDPARPAHSPHLGWSLAGDDARLLLAEGTTAVIRLRQPLDPESCDTAAGQ